MRGHVSPADRSENISRKSLIQSLQDQIAALQVELLQVRQQNAVLQRRMTRMEDGHEALQDQVGRQSIYANTYRRRCRRLIT